MVAEIVAETVKRTREEDSSRSSKRSRKSKGSTVAERGYESFKTRVLERDGKCVVTGANANECQAAHIYAHHRRDPDRAKGFRAFHFKDNSGALIESIHSEHNGMLLSYGLHQGYDHPTAPSWCVDFNDDGRPVVKSLHSGTAKYDGLPLWADVADIKKHAAYEILRYQTRFQRQFHEIQGGGGSTASGEGQHDNDGGGGGQGSGGATGGGHDEEKCDEVDFGSAPSPGGAAEASDEQLKLNEINLVTHNVLNKLSGEDNVPYVFRKGSLPTTVH